MIRLFKSRIYISVFTFALIPIILMSGDAPFFGIAIVGAIIHEFAHIIAMRIFGAKLIRISVYPFGADIKADTSVLTYKEETAVFLSGPFMSLVLTAVAFTLYGYVGGIYLLSFAVSNAAFFAVNILPVQGLDGGRALEAVLSEKCDIDFTQKACELVSTICFAILCVLSLVLLGVTGYNISLVFVCSYLFVAGYVKRKMCA